VSDGRMPRVVKVNLWEKRQSHVALVSQTRAIDVHVCVVFLQIPGMLGGVGRYLRSQLLQSVCNVLTWVTPIT